MRLRTLSFHNAFIHWKSDTANCLFDLIFVNIILFTSLQILGGLVVFVTVRKRLANGATRGCHVYGVMVVLHKSNRKAMDRKWSNQKANSALKTKPGNK